MLHLAKFGSSPGYPSLSRELLHSCPNGAQKESASPLAESGTLCETRGWWQIQSLSAVVAELVIIADQVSGRWDPVADRSNREGINLPPSGSANDFFLSRYAVGMLKAS